jgi:hypothetical protein
MKKAKKKRIGYHVTPLFLQIIKITPTETENTYKIKDKPSRG